MVVDTFYERGLLNAEHVWKQDQCLFPVFHFFQPLSLDWMYLIYFFMLVGALNLIKLSKFVNINCLHYKVRVTLNNVF